MSNESDKRKWYLICTVTRVKADTEASILNCTGGLTVTDTSYVCCVMFSCLYKGMIISFLICCCIFLTGSWDIYSRVCTDKGHVFKQTCSSVFMVTKNKYFKPKQDLCVVLK